MYIDRMCLQQNATQMLRGNLPSINVCCPHKIGFQMPGGGSGGRVEHFF